MVEVFDLMDEWGPEKVLAVYDTRTGMKGMVVIDNTARGMGKGGCRMAPDVTLWDCFRLARAMTWKWALADIFLGGAKAAIVADPKATNKEEIVRAFVRAVRKLLPDEYVFGNDMGFNEEDEAIIIDECGGDMRVAVGTPRELGGVPYGELGLTAYGVAEATEAAAEHLGIGLEGATASIQGLGAVGSFAAKFLHEKGVRIICISSISGALHDPEGIDIDELLKLKQEFRDAAVREYSGGKLLPLGDELTLDVDILIPAAKGDVITGDNVNAIKAKMIVEGANFPVTAVAEAVIQQSHRLLVPDIIANAGAAIATGKAMDNRYSCMAPDIDELYGAIKSIIRRNVGMILDEASRKNQSPRGVALNIAKERVLKAMKLRRRILA
ncbi:Glutamate dehydrogenase [subsurface metagenome]